MSDESTPVHRSQWIVLAVLLGLVGWITYRRIADRSDEERNAATAPPPRTPPAVADGRAAPPAEPVGTVPPTPSAQPSPTEPAPAAAEPVPAEDPDAPYGPGSARPLPDGSAPGPDYTIKGSGASKLFHTPSSPYFARTKAEAWFRTAEDARRAGFTEWKRKPRAGRSG